MKQSLEGLVNNVKNAMGDRDTSAWGWTLGEWLKHTVKIEQRVEELEADLADSETKTRILRGVLKRIDDDPPI